MPKLIVFDVDGTILDSQSHYNNAILTYSREKGLPDPCLRTIMHGYGEPHKHDFGWGVDKDTQLQHMIGTMNLADAMAMSGEVYLTPTLFNGVPENLALLKKMGYTLGIITSKPEAPLMHLLDHHGIRDIFSAIRSYDDIKRRGEKEKPEPDMLRSVMRELSFKPGDTTMIGDTTMDIRMGRGAETHTIGVSWGAHPVEHLVDAGAHHIVDTHFDDVAHTITKKIFG